MNYTIFAVALVAVVAIVTMVFVIKRHWTTLLAMVKEMKRKDNGKGYRVKDLYLDPILWRVVFRPVSSVFGGVMVAILVWGLFLLIRIFTGTINPINGGIFLAICALASIAFGMPEDAEVEVVPGTNMGALVTFWGKPIPIIRTSGEYNWTGKRLGLGRSTKVSEWIATTAEKTGEGVTDNNGYLNLGNITFQVWSSSGVSNEAGRATIPLPAKNRATVSGSLTLIINLRENKPRLWLDAENPALDIGDRARQEFQEIVDTLIDTDVASIQSEMQPYLFGVPFYTCFIGESTGQYKPGAMIRDRSGRVMYTRMKEGEDEEAVLERFRQELTEKADPKMLAKVTHEVTKPDGTKVQQIDVSKLKVSNPLNEVIESYGGVLKRVTFGDIKLSTKVAEAAEAASSEADQRQSQLASAKTIKAVRQELLPSKEELANKELLELNAVLAAAQDNENGNIKVVMVPGGNPLTSAMIAGAEQIGVKK